MIWCIQATITDIEYRTVQIPTFYLDSRVQGCLTALAASQVAHAILNPFNDTDLNVCVTVIRTN